MTPSQARARYPLRIATGSLRRLPLGLGICQCQKACNIIPPRVARTLMQVPHPSRLSLFLPMCP